MSKKSETFSAKDRVDHSVYGLGTIVESSERYTTILFDGAGSKRFITKMVKLVRSDIPAPPKPTRRKKAVTK